MRQTFITTQSLWFTEQNVNNAENKGEIQFSALLEQIEASLRKKLYFVAIMTSLVIPDICGAIDSNDGRANQMNYVAWFDKYVKPRFTDKINLTGDECYYLRCSMLHQGITRHKKIKEVVFMRFPQANTPVNLHLFRNSQQLLVEPVFLCNNLIIAAYDWLEAVHDNDLFKKNMENFMNLYSLSFY